MNDIRQCAMDMEYFLSIGWKKSDLDMLQRLWWKTLPIRKKRSVARPPTKRTRREGERE